MRSQLTYLLITFLFIGPYLLLFYKKESLSIRLLFISMMEIFILCFLITIVFVLDGTIADIVWVYNSFVWLTVFINLLTIIVLWIFKKIRRA